MQQDQIARRVLARMAAWLASAPPPEIARLLELAQLDSMRREVPMLLLIAALNVVIIMAACAHNGLPLVSYGWMGLLIVYCGVRSVMWGRIVHRAVDPARIPRLVRVNMLVSAAMISLLGIVTSVTFVTGLFAEQILIPVSLCFGAMAISHCLYALRVAARVTLIMGVFPAALAMLATGNFEAQMVACSMLSVGVLMLRFVSAQYDQLVARLLLERQNHDLANTDALTGLANRRAIMATLEHEVEAGMGFAVALIDLDGFKAINDRHGHQYGDQLLCVVGERLATASSADAVGRLGGDEFVVLFRTIGSAAEAAARADALLLSLCRPIEADGRPLAFGASLGFALAGVHGRTVEELLHHADEALYAAKRGQGGQLDRAVRVAA